MEWSDIDRKPIFLPQLPTHPNLLRKSSRDPALALFRISTLRLRGSVNLLKLCRNCCVYICICAFFLDKGLMFHLISKTHPWPRKDEERKILRASLPCMSSGRGGGEGLILDASDCEIFLSVHEWHILSQLLTGWVWALWGLAGGWGWGDLCEEKSLKGEKPDRIWKTKTRKENFEISQFCQWPNIHMANKRNLYRWTFLLQRKEILKRTYSEPVPLSFPTPPLLSLHKREKDKEHLMSGICKSVNIHLKTATPHREITEP